MIALIITIAALVIGFIYFYFTQIVPGAIIWWSIPIIFLVAWLAGFLLLVIFFGCCTALQSKKQKITAPKPFFNWFIYHMTIFLRGFYNMKVIVEGKELIPDKKDILIVSNHQSNLDPLMIISAFKGKPVTFIMKNNIMKVPIVGTWLYVSGFLPLDRSNNRKAMEVIDQAIERLQSGFSLAVYPEGTRSKGPDMNRFRNGIFRLIEKAQVDTVVLAIDNFYKVRKRFPFCRTKVLIRVCEVLKYEDVKDMHTNEIGDRVQKTIEDNLADARSRYPWLRQ
ncbi:MAG TPA: hypothetical protein GX390_04580 [Acholeplasmataceae bacterium]|jgi:1-acyl-sn-glycerol-3-phosphate acyltransferase|nr:hypothetical protein [Acholeplasmataceae bacterium]